MMSEIVLSYLTIYVTIVVLFLMKNVTFMHLSLFARPGEGRRADPGEFDILNFLKSKSPP